MDVKKLRRFEAPGHALTGDRSRRSRGSAGSTSTRSSTTARGWPTQRSTPTSGPRPWSPSPAGRFDWFVERGSSRAADDRQPLQLHAEPPFNELLAQRAIPHLRTRPYTPRTNGKIERFHQTLKREWAYALEYASSHAAAPGAATLAQPLQRATLPLRARQPATPSPRSGRPRAQHLDALTHLQIGDRAYKGWSVGEIAGSAGVTRLGVETVPQMVTRG